ncbi:universal stress protein [Falsiroseomonas selenitidurans]|uniref:Universal stress protein n=1 Tax=Falsiroseomonas selenitidurans TaxID=2716335 RepID=A0ABX1E5T4_9PROT|nr:universal stress protein [Falsiroseomonas selenitidurans]NKC32551.1 universal stress protein [Falsiroseomonas selenitidurans]
MSQSELQAGPGTPGWRSRVAPLLDHGPAQALICDDGQAGRVPRVVLGTRGRSGLAGFLPGSVARHLLACLPCDAMTIRPPA